MKLRVSTGKVLVGLVCIAVMLICTFLTEAIMDASNSSEWKSISIMLIVVLLILQLFFVKKIVPAKRLLIPVFIILEFIFHFSHVFLQNIGYDFGSNTRNSVFFRFSENIVKESTFYGIKASIAIFLGIALFYIFHSGKKTEKERIHIEKGNSLLTWIFLSIGLISDLSLSVVSLVSSSYGGYIDVQAALSNTFYGIRLLSYLLLPGVILYIQSSDRSNLAKKIVLYSFIIYKLITMFSGLRAYALINILLVIYIFMRQNPEFRIKFKYILIGVILLQVGGGLLVGIRETRTSGVDMSVIVQYMFDVKNNIIFNMLGEFGITQNVIALVTNNLNNLPIHGSQLLYSFIIIVPGISYLAPNLDYSSAFMEERYSMHNYGGSFIGDMLYDFGPEGYFVACVVLGFVLALVFEWFESKIDKQQSSSVAITSSIMIELLFCVRSSLAKIPRMTVWYLLIALVLTFITNSITVKKRY